MLERNCMAKLKINLQNPVWLSLGALFCCVLWGSAFPCVKIAYPLFKISDTGSQILFAGVRFFISGIITFIVGCILEKRILIDDRLLDDMSCHYIRTILSLVWSVKPIRHYNAAH